jgi:hypothetical protein
MFLDGPQEGDHLGQLGLSVEVEGMIEDDTPFGPLLIAEIDQVVRPSLDEPVGMAIQEFRSAAAAYQQRQQ